MGSFERLTCLLLLISSLSGCKIFSELYTLERGNTQLTKGKDQLNGARLVIEVVGEDSKRGESLAKAFRAELEDGNLFDSVQIAKKKSKSRRSSRLILEIAKYQSLEFGNWASDSEGWVVRYDLQIRLENNRGKVVLAGPLTGLAYDDDSPKDELTPEKRQDIDSAAQHSAAVLFADKLREEVDEKFEKELGDISPLILTAGTVPLNLAIIHIGVKRAHPAVRPAMVETDILTALGLAGKHLTFSSPREIEQIFEQWGLKRFTGLSVSEEEQKNLQRFTDDVLVLIRVSSTRHGVGMEAALLGRSALFQGIGTSLGDGESDSAGRFLQIGKLEVEARGLGALRLASASLAHKLIRLIDQAASKIVPKEEEPPKAPLKSPKGS